jgi:hypothetical protein
VTDRSGPAELSMLTAATAGSVRSLDAYATTAGSSAGQQRRHQEEAGEQRQAIQDG